ncbi:Protein transport protein SEC13-2 [Nakaseomyces glabratus]|nr:Protein transport protein SEC13-2 [Nakaseomyces glabratus]KTB20365.1 Protein transport protein SEC13-2 [Nakaseomyces glabratus]
MVKIENAHEGVIHHAALNYYGTRLATCSSDKTVKIFEINDVNNSSSLLETLVGHEGPVWYADWCHPSLGENLLATCGYDGKVLIWKESGHGGKMQIIAKHAVHSASVNCVKWAPHEYGLILLCGSADGKISVVELKDGQIASTKILDNAHKFGVNSISWAPLVKTDSSDDGDETTAVKQFISGGNDNLVKIWKFDDDQETYVVADTLEGHKDAVTAVDWSPTTLLQSYVASVSNDKQCLVWTQDHSSKKNDWKKISVNEGKFEQKLGSVSWSLSGNLLAVSDDDKNVTIWKESGDGKWEEVVN